MFTRDFLLSVVLALAASVLTGCPPSPAKVSVPDVKGMALSDASAALIAAGFTVDESQHESSGTVPSGVVLRQRPAGGTKAAPGAIVYLVVVHGAPR